MNSREKTEGKTMMEIFNDELADEQKRQEIFCRLAGMEIFWAAQHSKTGRIKGGDY